MAAVISSAASPVHLNWRDIPYFAGVEAHGLARLQAAAHLHSYAAGGNIFAELMSTVRVASLGQISEAFFEVGGQYRRNV